MQDNNEQNTNVAGEVNQNSQATDTEPTMSEATVSPTMAGNATPQKSNLLWWYLGLVLVGTLVFGVWYFMHERTEKTPDTQSVEREYPEVVARVNGEDVSREDFLEGLEQTKAAAASQGADMSDIVVASQVEAQALDVVINTKLLLQAAADAGIAITDEQVDQELAALQERYGGEEGFQAEMAKYGVTLEQLRVDVKEQLTVDAYLTGTEEFSGATVTEEEMTAFYDSLSSQGQDLPPYEEVKAQLEASLIGQKQQVAVSAIIDRLRTAADIETLL
ncbi:SurA N-terminal domain-containing protein [Candidatus Kaiserbacteria bacterium]|nr:SurA N-terminal domain-containing protein [Candidatus Kaiserbacteria bacterium]MCB9811313.1 SurA N-terminal domain-containing protein [Candidatus Nomurabacteria bacterium]